MPEIVPRTLGLPAGVGHHLGDGRAVGIAHRINDRGELGARANRARDGLTSREGIGGVHFMDTLRGRATFADGGVAGIVELVATIGFRDEPSGEQAIDDGGSSAAAQVGRQGFDTAIRAAGGGLENGGLGVGELGLGGHVDLR